MSIATDLQTIANNVPLVYNAGYEAGAAQGGGGNTEQILDEFASTVQYNGTRTDFNNTFLKSTITDETISGIFARWNSTIKRANYMFQDTKSLQEGLYTDALDFSQCDSLLSAFYNSNIVKVKRIDARATVSGWNGMANIFMNCINLESIDEFYPSLNTRFSSTFYGCINLVKIIFMSEIAVAGLEFNQCPKLNKESLDSVMNNLSSTTTGLTVILPLPAVNKAYETSGGANDGSTSTAWQNLVASKPNWTIAYA